MRYDDMTWIDLVKKHIPDVTDQQADYILWEETAFPLAGIEIVEKQIQEFKKIQEEYHKATNQ